MVNDGDACRRTEVEQGCIAVAGMPIHFVAAGSGPPVVLVHGQGENWATWKHVIPELARTRRVYAIDLPGAGKSARRGSLAERSCYYSDALGGLLKELRLSGAVLVGNSYGGLVSLRVALADPGSVARLCLVDSAALGRETHLLLRALSLPVVGELASAWCSTPWGAAQWTWIMATISFSRPHRIPVAWYENVARLARTPGHMAESVVAPVRSHLDMNGQREILLEALPRLRMPTLVIWGTDDRVVPRHHAAAAARQLSNTRVVMIPDCGHLPQVEQPSAFVAALHEFLAAQPGDHTVAGRG